MEDFSTMSDWRNHVIENVAIDVATKFSRQNSIKAHPLFENLLNKGPFKIFFFKNFTSVGPPTFKMPPRALDDVTLF